MYINTYIRLLNITYAASQVYDHWSQNVMLILQFAPQIGNTTAICSVVMNLGYCLYS